MSGDGGPSGAVFSGETHCGGGLKAGSICVPFVWTLSRTDRSPVLREPVSSLKVASVVESSGRTRCGKELNVK